MTDLPEGVLAIINYTNSKMKFRFGVEGPIYSISPYDNVYVSLKDLPENHYIKVMALLFKGGMWHRAYSTTWVLQKAYRGIFLLRERAGGSKKRIRLIKERIPLAGFGEGANPARYEQGELDPDAEEDDDDD